MTQDKKQVEQTTDMEVNFAKRFTDIYKKAGLISYSSIKGTFILHPYGYAIWGNFQEILDEKFEEIGHENVYLPMLIPEGLLQKEKDHVGGFIPECTWVTMSGSEKLEERYCIRFVFETLFCEHYANIIHSYRDLSKLYNQWCPVLWWEKTSRPSLHHREFLWQEGHTMHVITEEAITGTKRIFNICADPYENYLVMPMAKGCKTDKEKFSGAEATYTVECMMHDRKVFQAGTSHYFSNGFACAFDIAFAGKDNRLHRPFQTSWSVSIRLVGSVTMIRGDNNGLVLPPRIIPTQAVIISIAQHREGVIAANEAITVRLKAAGIRVRMDASSNSPGWKLAEYEMKGMPLHPESGPKDIEKSQCVLTRRDSDKKVFVSLDNIGETVKTALDTVQQGLFDEVRRNLDENVYACAAPEEVKERMTSQDGFTKTMWCGELACKLKVKEEAGTSSRCIPLEQEYLGDTCVCCGKPTKHVMYWGVAY